MQPLSKSKILAYRQCPRRLWLEVHRPQERRESTDTAARLRSGQRIGEIARRHYDPQQQGTVIDIKALGIKQALAVTQELLAARRPIFEAGFKTPDGAALVFVDALLPVTDSAGQPAWRLVEVKAATEVKNYYLQDVLFQTWVVQRCGLRLSSVVLAHVDKNWVYRGDGDYTGLLTEADVTAATLAHTAQAEAWLQAAQAVLAGAEPRVFYGSHCNTPYACDFQDYCLARETQPADYHPLLCLPEVRKKELKEYIQNYREQQGIIGMSDVPDELLNDKQLRVKKATLSQQCYFDDKAAADALNSLGFPAYFLDFESVNLAVPLWPDHRPYQQTPFQFSCHCLTADGCLTHEEFLDLSGNDPTDQFVPELIRACGEKGPIFVYHQAFEQARIRELAERYPQYKNSLQALNQRLVDLLPIVRAYYYHPAQFGSWSIKAVLPTIAPELDYGRLNGVRDGHQAAMAYEDALHADSTRRAQLEQQLRAYCRLDTFGLVRLWEFFTGRPPHALPPVAAAGHAAT